MSVAKKAILLVCLFVLTLSQRQLYFLAEAPFKEKPPALLELQNNPWDIPVMAVDCSIPGKCLKYKAPPVLPQLVLWPGPGNGYKQLGAPTRENLFGFFEGLENHPIKPLRDFLENISFCECMCLAFVVMFVLHSIFSIIFKDRSEDHIKQKEK